MVLLTSDKLISIIAFRVSTYTINPMSLISKNLVSIFQKPYRKVNNNHKYMQNFQRTASGFPQNNEIASE